MTPLDPAEGGGRDVLLVAPHPDDEALGCGGTLHLLARAGARVSVVVLARGDGGVGGSARAGDRRAECERACNLLEVGPPSFLDIASTHLREDPAAAARRLEQAVGRGAWDWLMVPSPLERHDTHRAALVAALQARLPRPGARWLGYGVWDAIPAVAEAVEVDVTAARAAKAQAIAAHASQIEARALAAGMAARDMAQAIFSRITGDESRRAIERLLVLDGLAASLTSGASVAAAVRAWLHERQAAWTDALWPE